MAAVAMVTKVQKMLNLLPTSQSFAVIFPVPKKERRKRNRIRIITRIAIAKQ
jgi:hypothetical protein